jgi:hypothetical protein
LRKLTTAGHSGAFGGGPTTTNIFNPGGSPGAGGPSIADSGDTYAPGDARLPKVLIPMIRRTFPELITNEIVGVQPMSGPVGLAFALRYAYQSTVLGDGTDGTSGPIGSSTTGPGWQPGKAVITVTSATYSGACWTTRLNELGYQLLDTRFTGSSSKRLSGTRTSDPVDWRFSIQDQGVAQILSAFEITGNIPQVEVKFEKTAVEAGTRRLGARWSVELEQDLKNMNGIDIDAEITNAMSYEIQAEIDREMLMRMIQAALNAGYRKGYSSLVTCFCRWSLVS